MMQGVIRSWNFSGESGLIRCRQHVWLLDQKEFLDHKRALLGLRTKWTIALTGCGKTSRGTHHLNRDSTATDSSFSPQMNSAAANASAQDSLQALP